MLVRFVQNWFAPDEQLRLRTEDHHPAAVVPDEWRKLLPRTVKIIEDAASDVVAPAPADVTLADLDVDRAGVNEMNRITAGRKPPRS